MRGLPVRVKENLNKARESALLAVDIYNKPATSFRSDGYIVMMIIAWTALLHAIFERDGIKYYYRKKNSNRYVYIDNDKKAWNLETSIKEYIQDGNASVRKNVEFFIKLRNKIEHRFLPELDHQIFGECQSLLLNFEEILRKEFGENYALKESLPISLQFSKMSDSTKTIAQRKGFLEVMKFIEDYRGELDDSIWNNEEYSFRVFLIPKIGNNPKTSDLAVEFVHYDPTNVDEMEKYKKAVVLLRDKHVPVVNLDKFRPGEVVEEIKKTIPEFTMNVHTKAWKYYRVRPESASSNPENCNTKYCVYDRTHKDYVYTDTWIRFLINKLSDEKEMETVKKVTIGQVQSG
ncbi:MAG: DUF3644 domain-containing protein [Halobacteriota archaeon]|nr:DUF3644 domain-containing protein [Halobacteriota archaeon]